MFSPTNCVTERVAYALALPVQSNPMHTQQTLPQKVELTVTVECASLQEATLRDLKSAVYREVFRLHGIRLPVKRQKVVVLGNKLEDNDELLAPRNVISGEPNAKSLPTGNVPVFVVCQPTSSAAKASKKRSSTKAPSSSSSSSPSPLPSSASKPSKKKGNSRKKVQVELSVLLAPAARQRVGHDDPWVVDAQCVFARTIFCCLSVCFVCVLCLCSLYVLGVCFACVLCVYCVCACVCACVCVLCVMFHCTARPLVPPRPRTTYCVPSSSLQCDAMLCSDSTLSPPHLGCSLGPLSRPTVESASVTATCTCAECAPCGLSTYSAASVYRAMTCPACSISD